MAETVGITIGQRRQLYGRCHELGVFDLPEATDGLVGGPAGSVQPAAGGLVHHPGTSGLGEDGVRVLKDVADAARELVPAVLWLGRRTSRTPGAPSRSSLPVCQN